MQATCAHCGEPFEAHRRDQRFCSRRCNSASHRDSGIRSCVEDGCEKPVRARDLCVSHYNRRHTARTYYDITCAHCGSAHRTRRPDGLFCSETCHREHRYSAYRQASAEMQRQAKLPVLWKRPRLSSPEPATRSTLWTAGQCRACAAWFIDVMPQARYCSVICGRRWHRRQRAAREYGATGTFTWSEVMRVYLLFDRRCAYCDEVMAVGQIEPDHVVPISRGGANSITNILPACRSCNGDKRNLLLEDWNPDRARRGLPPRRTEWTAGDPRVIHLTCPIRPARTSL
jgi:5-methylcytosine-specific restriction endonuclease McrA